MATDEPQGLVETFRTQALGSLPAVSILTFVIAAIKVFRASGMEASTTVAVVSDADLVALLKGVVLSLLPAFIAGLIGFSIWSWAQTLPKTHRGGSPTEGELRLMAGALGRDFGLVWALVVVGFFTVPWPIFLLFFIPMLLCSFWLIRRTVHDSPRAAKSLPSWVRAPFRMLRTPVVTLSPLIALLFVSFFLVPRRTFLCLFLPLLAPVAWLLGELFVQHGPASGRFMHLALRAFGGGAAAVFVLYLTLTPTVWLPLRLQTFTLGHGPQLDGITVGQQFGAYVLSTDTSGSNLLVDVPRAVVHAGPGILQPDPPICIPQPSPVRFYSLRPSQVLGLGKDVGSPYRVCTGGAGPQPENTRPRVGLLWGSFLLLSLVAWTVATRPTAQPKRTTGNRKKQTPEEGGS